MRERRLKRAVEQEQRVFPTQDYVPWSPYPLPEPGSVRTDGEYFADYLPNSARDLAPWRMRTADGRGAVPERVTHRVVYAKDWRPAGRLAAVHHEDLTARPEPPNNTAAELRLSMGDIHTVRIFRRGDACPDDLAAVVDRVGRVWPRIDWNDGILTSWNELLDLNAMLIEVPVELLRARLVADTQAHQTRPCEVSA